MSQTSNEQAFVDLSPKESEALPTGHVGGSRKKVFVGLSGGVDSSVSAALLKEQGFDVTGVFIRTWHPDFVPCDWKEDRRDAMRVAAHLDIPFLTLDLEEEYKKGVADYMISEYKKGMTPNPDVMCNKEVKFGGFLKFALENGANFIATGHYARIAVSDQLLAVRKDPDFKLTANSSRLKALRLLEGTDKNKDQSYFLWTLTQEQLRHVLFPVGHMHKIDVRKEAERFGLPTALKKDSQGVCFLGDIDMKDFLKHYIDAVPGDVLDVHGDIIGRHDGALFHTIGERHKFTITKKGTDDPKLFVVAKDVERNTITVSSDPANADVNPYIARELRLESANWIAGVPAEGKTYGVRIRYRQKPIGCTIEGDTLILSEPQHGVSSGQSAVVYDGDECMGGGIIG